MRRAALFLLKLALAVALLAWVGSRMAWQDQLQVVEKPGAEPQILHGTLYGDWQGGEWIFTTEDGGHFRPPHRSSLRPRPGFPQLFRSVDLRWFLAGCALWSVLVVLSAARWRLLLGAVGVPTSYRESLRLVMIGNFFNNVMLGTTGGDVVRAMMRTTSMEEKRWRAVISVMVDRVTGVFALLLLAAAALAAARFDPELAHLRILHYATLLVFAMLFAVVAFALVYGSARVRRVVGRLPLLGRLRLPVAVQRADEAGIAFRDRRKEVVYAVLLSLPLQVAGILAFWCFGCALGSPLRAMDSFIVFPTVQAVSSVPLAPAGWGVGETLYGWFHARLLGGPEWFTMGVAASVLFRLTTQVGFGLVGGAVWVLSRQNGPRTPQSA